MDKKVAAAVFAGLLVTLAAYIVVDIYLAGIVVIFVIVIIMSLLMMADSKFLPDIQVELRDDAKAIILRNSGNSVALKVHVALVPLNIEFDIPSLAVEEKYEYQVPSMIETVKVAVTFQNEKDAALSRTYNLNALEGNYDPLKPMIPVFRWK